MIDTYSYDYLISSPVNSCLFCPVCIVKADASAIWSIVGWLYWHALIAAEMLDKHLYLTMCQMHLIITHVHIFPKTGCAVRKMAFFITCQDC